MTVTRENNMTHWYATVVWQNSERDNNMVERENKNNDIR